MSGLNNRKLEHIEIVAQQQGMDRKKHHFDGIHLTHRALPELKLEDVDASVEFMGKRLSFPLLISSMTGGADEELVKINRNLAIAAEAEQVALAVGSQRVLFSDAAAQASFELRDVAPNALLLGNLGAVQLNYGMGAEECRAAVQILGADGLYLHLNPLQEAVQPEGDTDFSNLRSRIAEVVERLDVPVLVKEVGAGISPEDAVLLQQAGVKYLDVAGSGGTSWSMVESRRSEDPALGELFADWGIPTPLALRKLRPVCGGAELVASGGLRNGIDMAKAMVLGASLCGLARPFLKPAMESADAVREVIRRLKREFETAMFLLGADTIKQIKGNEGLILHETWN